jgi:hypothetical protein
LLFLKGHSFSAPTPGQDHARDVLKKKFYGKPKPPRAGRIKLALDLLDRSDAVERLRERRSFRHFEEQLAGWR